MGMAPQISWNYDRNEILADGIVHVVGVVMAFVGAAVLVTIAIRTGNIVRLAAVAIYLAGLLSMVCFSAVYNLWPVSTVKWWLRRFDQSAIYLLIAATYTAFMLPIDGIVPVVVLAIVWSAALAGMTIKLLRPGCLDRAAIAVYLTMGWSGVFTMRPIAAALASATVVLIATGGVLYSVGVVFFLWNNLRFQNAIWHGFVLAAAACHYAAVLTSLAAA
jgi:hemolysin III